MTSVTPVTDYSYSLNLILVEENKISSVLGMTLNYIWWWESSFEFEEMWEPFHC